MTYLIAISRIMRQSMLLLILPALSYAEISQQTHNARLENLVGTVLVDQGERFVMGQPGMLLRTGYRVIVLENATVDIVFRPKTPPAETDSGSDVGCELSLAENSLVLLRAEGGCEQSVIRAGDPSSENAQRTPTAEILHELAPVNCVLFDCLPAELRQRDDEL